MSNVAGTTHDKYSPGFVLRESLLRSLQLLLSSRLFNFPLLLQLRSACLRGFFPIGSGTRIADHVSIENHHNIRGSFRCGSHVEIAHGAVLDITGGLVLEDGVWISERALLLTHDHRITPDTPKAAWPLDTRPKTIATDAWVGANAIVLPSANRIGVRAVVAAGSVVSRDVPDHAVVAGVPARVVGSTSTESPLEET